MGVGMEWERRFHLKWLRVGQISEIGFEPWRRQVEGTCSFL